jgi:hypothetical protein
MGWCGDLFRRDRVDDASCGLVKARMANGSEDMMCGWYMATARRTVVFVMNRASLHTSEAVNSFRSR